MEGKKKCRSIITIEEPSLQAGTSNSNYDAFHGPFTMNKSRVALKLKHSGLSSPVIRAILTLISRFGQNFDTPPIIKNSMIDNFMYKNKIMTKYNPVEKEHPSHTNFIADEASEKTVFNGVGRQSL